MSFNLSNIPAQAVKVYTGNILQSIPVISQLNPNDLEPGKHYHFFFQGGR